jgi:MoxR-like ATPase
MNELVRAVPAAGHVVDYASRLVLALHPDGEDASDDVRRHVRLGPSPRGAQALALAGRVAALMDGRVSLAFEDVRAVALPALRHRLMLSFDAERAGISADDLVRDAVARVPTEP